ncbi:MAG: hypothetical protein ILO68_00670 [Clostridia bacterium]|nr:hypothetical protein [Clostridia bacterium]
MNLFEMKDHSAEYEQEDINKNRVFGILAYIGPLFLVGLFAAKDSKWAKYHVNQGMVLCIAVFAVAFTLGLLGLIPYIGIVFRILNWITSIGLSALCVMGIIFAATGKAKDLPLIGSIKLLK